MKRLNLPAWSSAARLALAVAMAAGAALGRGPVPTALAAPANDDFAAAVTITGPGFAHSADTTSATREAGEVPELSSCGSFPVASNTHSVWYMFQASADGWVILDTLASSPDAYDTVLEVWTSGASPAASIGELQLPSLACADDSGKGSRKSEVNFSLTAGHWYYAMVRDFGSLDTGGTLVLTGLFSSVQQIFVDTLTGDDTSNTGSASLPFKTIQKGVNEVAVGGRVNVAAGSYPPATINKRLSLVGSGGPTATSFTLTAGARLGPGSGGITAPTVYINQVGGSGASLQDALTLAATDGMVNVAAGTYTDTLNLSRSVRLVGSSGAIINTGAGTTAVTLSAGTASLTGLTIQNAATAILVTGGSGHVISSTNLLTHTAFAVNNTSGVAVTAVRNYWGSSTGPTHASNPGGAGQTVGDLVAFSPWCTLAAPTCTPLAGIAARLVFNLSPGNSQAGTPLIPQPIVRAEDPFGNLGINFGGSVSLAIRPGTGAPSAVLGGTTSKAAVNGVADFAASGLTIDRVGTGYVLSATTSGLLTGSSLPFSIVGSTLAFLVSPGTTPARASLSPSPQVAAGDGLGGVDTTFTGPITVTLKPGSGTPGAVLSGTLVAQAVNGVATFSNLNIDRLGQNYRLQAVAAGYALSESLPFTITANRLTFQTSPGTTAAGASLTPSPVVRAVDDFGTVDPTFGAPVTVALIGGTPGAALGGTPTLTASAGVVTYTNLSVNLAGVNYQLRATSSGLTLADSTAFTVTSAAATQLRFSTSPPASSRANQAFAAQVLALDPFGNQAASFNSPITVSVKAGTGNPAAVLGGTRVVTATGGLASFSGLSLDRIGLSYQLQAVAAGLPVTDSTAFNITADRLLFVASPGSGLAGNVLAPNPVVSATDGFGTTDTTFVGSVSLSLAVNPGGAALNGTNPRTAVGGAAAFNDLVITKAAAGYVLSATSGVLLAAASSAFTITHNSAAQLAFLTQPGNGTAGVPLSVQPVAEVQDAFGNGVRTFASPITASIATGPAGASLSGTAVVNAVSGVVTYTNLSFDKAGPYTLLVSRSGLASATSASFTIGPAAPVRLVFQAQPSDSQTLVPFPTQPVVRAEDNFGNTATSFVGTVALALRPGTGTPGAGLAGTTSLAAAGGVASFSGVSIDRVGTGSVISATAGGLASAASQPLTITKATAAILLAPLTQTYDGTPRAVGVSTTPAGLSLTVTYTGTGGTAYGPSTTPPTNAGTYMVGVVVDDPNYQGQINTTLLVLKAAGTVALGNVFQTYDGTPRAVTTATTPLNFIVVVTYTGTAGTVYGPATTPPVNAGTYEVVGVISDTNYAGDSGSLTLSVARAAASVNLTNLTQTYDGTPRAVTTATTPAGLRVTVTYSGTAGTVYGPSTTPPVNAGVYQVTASINETNYQGTSVNILTVNRASQSITFGPLASKLLSDPPFGITATASSGLPVSFTSATPTVCSVAGSTVSLLATGTCFLFADQPGDLNYNAATPVFQSFTVGKGNQTITFDPLADRPITASPFVVTATASSGLLVSFASATPSVCSVAGSTVSLLGTGTCTLTASQPGDSSWNATADVSRSFQVTRASQTISFAPLPDRLLTQSPFTVTASATSGLPVTFSTTTPGVCTVSGVTVTLVGAGLCVIQADQAGSSIYSAAVPVQRSFTVGNLFRAFLPALHNNLLPRADLVVSLSVSPATPAAGQPAVLTVRVSNVGSGVATPFWVDLYINPSSPPTGPNVPWNSVCGLTPCYGLAWYVQQPLGAGQSLTLSSTAASYYAQNTLWPGFFAPGTRDLYVFVDSFNPGVATAAVLESNEANNRAELHFPAPLAGMAGTAPDLGPAADLPDRPIPGER